MAIKGTGNPPPKFVTVAPIGSEFSRVSIDDTALTQCLVRTADMAIRATAARAAKPGHSVLPMMSGSSLKAAPSKDLDLVRTNAILNSITQRESVEISNTMQLFRNMLCVSRDLRLRVAKVHEEFHGKAASNPRQQVTEDVEMEEVDGMD
jgi:hypothetical protein